MPSGESFRHIVIIGAGMGGLAAAIMLSARGERVTLFERADYPGGKMRRLVLGGTAIDAGPTVFTMRHIFDEIFANAGTSLEAHVGLEQADILARHAWPDGTTLDLFKCQTQSADAIGRFAGLAAASGYRRFCADSRAMFDTLYESFMRQPEPSMKALFRGASVLQLSRTRPFQNLWTALGSYFKDPRLRQLFGRYATYVGSSPFLAPATLMLIAHVEQAGVWHIKGGMHELALAMARIAKSCGTDIRLGEAVRTICSRNGHIERVELESGETVPADAVIFNGDSDALAQGLLGRDLGSVLPKRTPASRSLSALTWAIHAPVQGFDLTRHNVFFGSDYAREFDELTRQRRLPGDPTVYVCAQARGNSRTPINGPEPMLLIVNAPARGDQDLPTSEVERCEQASFQQLERMGLRIGASEARNTMRTGPAEFERLFPASGGALYGQAGHGWRASFTRPGQRTRIKGLYLAGGSVHPGAGVPMAALSGLTAAASLASDLALMSRSTRKAMSGGMRTG